MNGRQHTPPQKDSDPQGTSLSYLAGVLLGVVLVAPPLSQLVSIADLRRFAFDPLASSLLGAVFAILFVAVGTMALYRSFELLER